jgi:DHA2 family multidrug resistance protein-like MFS transporter
MVFLAFLAMFLLWKENISYWEVAIPYVFLGIGVGLSGTPSSNSLTGSVPVTRVGMASGTADLQRDLGGALMTSIFGALLTAGYASAMGAALAGTSVSENTQAQLQLSFASAENVASHHPAQANQILSAAQSAFLKGDQWAYLAAMVAVLIGMALVFKFFPKKEQEAALRAAYHAHDEGEAPSAEPSPIHVPAPGEGQEPAPGHIPAE